MAAQIHSIDELKKFRNRQAYARMFSEPWLDQPHPVIIFLNLPTHKLQTIINNGLFLYERRSRNSQYRPCVDCGKIRRVASHANAPETQGLRCMECFRKAAYGKYHRPPCKFRLPPAKKTNACNMCGHPKRKDKSPAARRCYPIYCPIKNQIWRFA